jgi:DNA-binding NtrC family response regulator
MVIFWFGTQAKADKPCSLKRGTRSAASAASATSPSTCASSPRPTAISRAVADGRFRLDLYHRLRVVEITLPPLRDRGDDIDLLAMHFVASLAAELGKPGTRISVEALRALRGYAWPGNVRELRNVLERAIVLCRGDEVRLGDLPREVRGAGDASPLGAPPAHLDPRGLVPLEEVIRGHVAHVFRACNENVTHTARVLGISRVSLRRRLNEYGIRRGGPAGA